MLYSVLPVFIIYFRAFPALLIDHPDKSPGYRMSKNDHGDVRINYDHATINYSGGLVNYGHGSILPTNPRGHDEGIPPNTLQNHEHGFDEHGSFFPPDSPQTDEHAPISFKSEGYGGAHHYLNPNRRSVNLDSETGIPLDQFHYGRSHEYGDFESILPEDPLLHFGEDSFLEPMSALSRAQIKQILDKNRPQKDEKPKRKRSSLTSKRSLQYENAKKGDKEVDFSNESGKKEGVKEI